MEEDRQGLGSRISPRDRRATLRAAFYIVNVISALFGIFLLFAGDFAGSAIGILLIVWAALNIITHVVEGGATLGGIFPVPSMDSAEK